MAKRRGLLQHAVKAVKQQQKTAKTGPGPKSTPASKPATRPRSGPPAAKRQKTGKSNQHQQQNQKPTIPFQPDDPILLVGEGDLSFAASLVTHHHCTNVTATVLEKTPADLTAKYPHVASNIAAIEACPTSRVLYNIDARKLPPFTTKSKPPHHHQNIEPPTPTGAMKRIIFNFPHTGGKSTDVNRQVRHNQELLVDFFRRAQLSLCPGGTIIVTLFEGEPYTLWNIRDLARHAGLQVERSFRFVAGVYPGYHHARTLGVVKSRRTGEVARGAWRGEEREARSFVFVRKGEGSQEGVGRSKRKRGGDGGSSDEESESEESEVEEEGSEEEGWGDGGVEGSDGGELEQEVASGDGDDENDPGEDEKGETDDSGDGD
jgi:25S rRNA (uracil2634-N3)-methyltransferase